MVIPFIKVEAMFSFLEEVAKETVKPLPVAF